MHRKKSHTRRATECELACLDAFGADGAAITPGCYQGRDAEAILSEGIDGLDAERFLVPFRFLKGYRCARNLSAEDEAKIETSVMLRRMASRAWIGSHIKAQERQELPPGFAATTPRPSKACMKPMGRASG